jgi:hypothetical protein
MTSNNKFEFIQILEILYNFYLDFNSFEDIALVTGTPEDLIKST